MGDRLDPHMEALCKKVRKFSVSTAGPNADSLDNTSSVNKEYEVSDAEKEDEKHFLRLQNDWIARSLTSIAPRCHAQTGECTIQSCLAQFTAPELLTGPNKWACDKCTRLHAEMTPESTTEDNTTENTKPKTIYSNASKQLLIFCPPGVLTIHLKRFQNHVQPSESQQTCGISNPLEFSSFLFNHQSQHVKRAFRSHRNSLHSLRRCRTFRSTRWRPLHRFCQITNRQLRRKFRQKILFDANRQKRGNSQSFSGNCAEIFGERFRVSRHRSSCSRTSFWKVVPYQ